MAFSESWAKTAFTNRYQLIKGVAKYVMIRRCFTYSFPNNNFLKAKSGHREAMLLMLRITRGVSLPLKAKSYEQYYSVCHYLNQQRPIKIAIYDFWLQNLKLKRFEE